MWLRGQTYKGANKKGTEMKKTPYKINHTKALEYWEKQDQECDDR